MSDQEQSYGDDGPSYGDDGPAYGDEGPAPTDEGPAYTDDVPAYADDVPAYADDVAYGDASHDIVAAGTVYEEDLAFSYGEADAEEAMPAATVAEDTVGSDYPTGPPPGDDRMGIYD